MSLIYFFILLAFTNSFNVIDLEPYRYIYYMNDIEKTEDKIVIYRFVPESKNRNIHLSFLGQSISGSFDFYLYSDIPDIDSSQDESFSNYLQKFGNYGEIQINSDFQSLEIFYILVKMNSYKEEYKYLSFMMYNSEEYIDITKHNDYIFAFEGDQEIIFNYPTQNFAQSFYIEVEGECENINYYLYKNNTEPELEASKTGQCSLTFNKYQDLLEKDNNYFIKFSVENKNKMIRFLLYFLDNEKNIEVVNDSEVDIKYSYTNFKKEDSFGEHDNFFL